MMPTTSTTCSCRLHMHSPASLCAALSFLYLCPRERRTVPSYATTHPPSPRSPILLMREAPSRVQPPCRRGIRTPARRRPRRTRRTAGEHGPAAPPHPRLHLRHHLPLLLTLPPIPDLHLLEQECAFDARQIHFRLRCLAVHSPHPVLIRAATASAPHHRDRHPLQPPRPLSARPSPSRQTNFVAV